MKIKAEINEIEIIKLKKKRRRRKETQQRIKETKSLFLEKINNIDKPLSGLRKKKKR